jgi:hypothetical protein
LQVDTDRLSEVHLFEYSKAFLSGCFYSGQIFSFLRGSFSFTHKFATTSSSIGRNSILFIRALLKLIQKRNFFKQLKSKEDFKNFRVAVSTIFFVLQQERIQIPDFAVNKLFLFN